MTNKHCFHGICHNDSRKKNPSIKFLRFQNPQQIRNTQSDELLYVIEAILELACMCLISLLSQI